MTVQCRGEEAFPEEKRDGNHQLWSMKAAAEAQGSSEPGSDRTGTEVQLYLCLRPHNEGTDSHGRAH